MTHNIQIGVTVDDDSIEKSVMAAALADIRKGLFGQIINKSNYTYFNAWEYHFSDEFKRDYLDPIFDKMFSDPALRQVIAKETAAILAERLLKSNSFKKQIGAEMEAQE